MKIIINQKFKDLIPPLSDDEYKGLEESILAEGCRDALILWNDTLVDGHNRYEICQKHGIEFKTVRMEFDSEEDAEFWIIKNQLSRRNIGPGTRIILAKKLEPWLREKARERQSEAGGDKRSEEAKTASVNIDKSDIEPIDVRKEIADAARVSTGTLAKFNRVEKERPDLIKDILSGEKTINKAYTEAKKEPSEKTELETMAKESERDKVKRLAITKDIWKMLDSIDAFLKKYTPNELNCLVYSSEADRALITGKINDDRKSLAKISNAFSVLGAR